jgi:hypothetical protein
MDIKGFLIIDEFKVFIKTAIADNVPSVSEVLRSRIWA